MSFLVCVPKYVCVNSPQCPLGRSHSWFWGNRSYPDRSPFLPSSYVRIRTEKAWFTCTSPDTEQATTLWGTQLSENPPTFSDVFLFLTEVSKETVVAYAYVHTDFGTLPCTAFMAWSLIALLGFFIQALPAWKFSEKKKTNWLECFFQGVTASTSVFSRCALSLHMSSFQAAQSTSCFDSGLFFLSCRVLNVKLGV